MEISAISSFRKEMEKEAFIKKVLPYVGRMAKRIISPAKNKFLLPSANRSIENKVEKTLFGFGKKRIQQTNPEILKRFRRMKQRSIYNERAREPMKSMLSTIELSGLIAGSGMVHGGLTLPAPVKLVQ